MTTHPEHAKPEELARLAELDEAAKPLLKALREISNERETINKRIRWRARNSWRYKGE